MTRSQEAFDANILRWRREIATEILEGVGYYARRVKDGIEQPCHDLHVPRPQLITISNQARVRPSRHYLALKVV